MVEIEGPEGAASECEASRRSSETSLDDPALVSDLTSKPADSGKGSDPSPPDDLSLRVKALEAWMEKRTEVAITLSTAQRKWLIAAFPEFIKSIAWPSVFLVVLFFIREPLAELLRELPKKFRESTEFQAGSISFRTRLQTSAKTLGGSDLANRVGHLSASAVRTLLWGEGTLTTVSFGRSDDDSTPAISALHIPGKVLIEGIPELRDKGLIGLSSNFSGDTPGPKTFEQYVEAVNNLTGSRWDIGEGILGLKLNAPWTREQADEFGAYWTWEPTRDGEFAISLILEAVEKELTEQKTATNDAP